MLRTTSLLNLLAFFTIAVAASQSAAAVSNTWRMCDNCSPTQKEHCAIAAAAADNLKTGDYVWIADFSGESTSKYFISVLPPGTIQGEESELSDHILNGPQITPFPEALSSHEAYVWDAVIAIVNEVYRPQGAGYDYPACGLGNLLGTGDRSVIAQAPFSQEVNLPPGPGSNSAYDIIGNQAMAMDLARAHAGVLGSIAATQSFFTQWIKISPINSQTSLILVFSDGSSGIWRFSFERNRWEPDWSSFEDSDGNPIPLTQQDLQPGLGWWFSGTSQGEENLENFLARAALFGIPITGPGAGCSPSPIRCEISEDGLLCWFAQC